MNELDINLFQPADAVPLEEVRSVLVIKFRHLGDVLLSSPVFSVLKRSIPQAAIDALVYEDTRPMLEGHPAIREIQGVDKRWKSLGVTARLTRELNVIRAVRSHQYDLVINLTEGDRGAVIAAFSGARWRVGVRHSRNKPSLGIRPAYTHWYLTDFAKRHIVEQNLDALRRIGIRVPMHTERLTFELSDESRRSAQEKLQGAGWRGNRYAVVHPTSRWLFKCLEEEKIAQLLRYLKKTGFDIVLTSAPDAHEKAMINRILSLTDASVLDLSGRLTLKELGAVIEKARLFCGTDSVPMHMAAAFGIPAVAWFGPTYDTIWGPWLVPHEIVKDSVLCRPCGFDGCGGGKRSECLMNIPAAGISAAVEKLQEHWAP